MGLDWLHPAKIADGVFGFAPGCTNSVVSMRADRFPTRRTIGLLQRQQTRVLGTDIALGVCQNERSGMRVENRLLRCDSGDLSHLKMVRTVNLTEEAEGRPISSPDQRPCWRQHRNAAAGLRPEKEQELTHRWESCARFSSPRDLKTITRWNHTNDAQVPPRCVKRPHEVNDNAPSSDSWRGVTQPYNFDP